MFVEYFMQRLNSRINAWNIARQDEPNRILCKIQMVLTKSDGYLESMVAYLDVMHKYHRANIQINLGKEQPVATIQSLSWKEKRKSRGRRSVVCGTALHGPLFHFDFGAPEFDDAEIDRMISAYVAWLDQWAKPLYHISQPR